MPAPAPALTPGLLVLHGNRLERLAETVLGWLARHPLAPLEEETLLVQSNGMAEWLKMELAAAHGVCAAARVELPARFVWRTYRAVLGREAVPAVSPLDKLPLTWRLMQLLPGLLGGEHAAAFAPVAGFLFPRPQPGLPEDREPRRGAAGMAPDETRQLQLAQRLADLFDQYQVYRSDWLRDWEGGQDEARRGRDLLRTPLGTTVPVPDDQRWQPALWRAVVSTLSGAERQATRPALHERFLRALVAAPPGDRPPAGVPRRVVIFGTTHVPAQTLEAVAALARHCQVLLAVPNPCRHHWADLIEGRELLRATRRRHAHRGGVDLAPIAAHSPEALHAHGHPLLAAWGRQSRDFIRQLDAYDDAQVARERFAIPRIDLFDGDGDSDSDQGPGPSLLQQVQAHIRDLVPLAEHGHRAIAPDDRSIVFHQAHSAQREVEVLHDQLLELLARPPQAAGHGVKRGPAAPLAPRQIVVMVPDIDAFAPAIRSVFGQHARGDARHIPWGIADLRERAHNPLLAALEWVLRAPLQRFTATELLGLLEVPAVARRFGLAGDDLPLLQSWIAAAGVRWGLDVSQRVALGLEACGDTNTWAFGLRRMLLGYAVGEPRAALDEVPDEGAADGAASGAVTARLAAIEPCAEVAGLSAGLAGTLAELLALLQAWWHDAAHARTPAAWGERLHALMAALLLPVGTAERATMTALADGLAAWLQACEAAAFDEPVTLAVAREAWLEAVDEPGLAQRFRAGGVTFCTLLPLRAIPFEVVCLLGMNDGDYPRRSTRSDFDLMGLPGHARPGDRSRRDDDRQLMLDALLSARRVLYVSWCGRSQRDNQAQPPSVLVAQLRDYLAAGWSPDVVDARTTSHPLQPFGRAYFEERGGLFTYATEWRAAFDAAAPVPPPPQSAAQSERDDVAPPVTLDDLARFLRNPVKSFFRRRLGVAFDEAGTAAEDDEPFESGGLDRWRQIDEVLHEARRRLGEHGGGDDNRRDDARLAPLVQAQLARMQRAGSLPLAGPGEHTRATLHHTLHPMLVQWQRELAARPHRHEKQPLRWDPSPSGPHLEDWLVGLRGGHHEVPAWVELMAGTLADKQGKKLQQHKLLPAWLRLLAASACEVPLSAVLVGSDVVVTLEALADGAASQRTLAGLMQAFAAQAVAAAPLPTALRTGLKWLAEPDKAAAVYDGSTDRQIERLGERREPCLARLYPDYEALSQAPDFEAATHRLYAGFAAWLQSKAVSFEPLPDAVLADDEGEESE